MIAAIVNALGILIGGTLGTLLRSKINHKLVDCLMTAMGLVVVSVGVQGIVGSTDTMCLVLCLAIGAIIGQALRIDEFIDGMGVRVAKLFEGKKFAEGRFADGVISASVMFTVGGAIFIGMGLNMIGITDRKVNVPNLLPALLLPILYVPLASWIGDLL